MQEIGWFRSRGFQVLIVSLLLLGVFFRFVNLDRKVYWHDEAFTSLRVSGYTSTELNQQIFNGQVISIEDLQKYQQPRPEKGLIDTIKSLAIDDAQHPPIYYVLVRLWVQGLGNSVGVTRSFSALVSLLVFPCVYGLCRELFDSLLVGWVSIALIAVSPFHVLYAQEAREYSLWTVTILLSSWAILRALRITKKAVNTINIKKTWGVYAATLALGLYTFPLTAIVGFGHGIYVILTEGFRLTKIVTAYLLALLIALISFAPWLAFAHTRSRTGIAWTEIPIPLITLLKIWGLHLNRAFILTVGDFGFDNILTYLTLPIFLILVCYSIYFICSQTSKQVWLFVLTLMGTLSLTLVLPDLILGGQRSASSRYLVPFYLGIQLSIAYLLASQSTKICSVRGKFAQVVMVVLITVGVVSCAISSQAETAWNKVVSYNLPQLSQMINRATAPLLISNSSGINFGNILALSHRLSPKTRLQLVDGRTQPDFLNVPNIPQGFSDVFFLNPSEQFQQKIEQEYNFKLNIVYSDYHLQLWKLANSKTEQSSRRYPI